MERIRFVKTLHEGKIQNWHVCPHKTWLCKNFGFFSGHTIDIMYSFKKVNWFGCQGYTDLYYIPMWYFLYKKNSSTFLCAMTRIHQELICPCAYILVLPILIPKFISLFQPSDRKKKRTNTGLTLRNVAEINFFWCGQNVLWGNNLKGVYFLRCLCT